MRDLVDYINEGKVKALNAEDIKSVLTPGDYNGTPCVIIGEPFTNDRDEAYIMAKEYAKKLGYGTPTMDLKDVYNELGDAASDVDYFVLVAMEDEVSCFVYGTEGVYGIS